MCKRPNIVLIIADDMGFSDIGCYGSEIETPNLDKMAEKGMRFSSMYNNARCCPSRASLLTGLYPHQAGVGQMEQDLKVPAYQGRLNKASLTLAELLKIGGYNTGMSGKWHVGGNQEPKFPETWDINKEDTLTPKQRGFDRFYGTLAGAGSYYNPHTLMSENEFINVSADQDFYYTDEISKKAVEFIEDFGKESKPFFLYVSYTAPHWPLHARPEDISKYEGKYNVGWDVIRKQRYERLKEIGMINNDWELSPRDEKSHSWETEEHKEYEAKKMAVYAAQVDSMDQGIGRIINKIEELGMKENTLIIFVSDNGGCAEFLREDGYIAKNLVLPTRKGEKVVLGYNPDVNPGPEETYMSYELPWANVSNTPFRYYKHFIHEGGISTPMIIHWPGCIKKNNIINHYKSHFIDIMATFVDVSGVHYPAEYNGRKITP